MCAAVYVNIFFVAFPILFLLYLFRGIPSCLDKDNNYRKRRQSIEKKAEEKIELLYTDLVKSATIRLASDIFSDSLEDKIFLLSDLGI